MSLFFILCLEKELYQILKRHTHTINGPSLSLWMEKSRNLWRPSKAATNPRTRTSERQSGMWYDRVRRGADGISWMLLLGYKLISLLAVTLQYFPVLALGFRLASTTVGLGEGERKLIKRKKEKKKGTAYFISRQKNMTLAVFFW